jgi:uncharacterized phage infection (PIP) family protein YhgE
MISQIATASTQQSSATEQINSSISQISSLTQESSAAADQTAKACADLSNLALDLQKMVSQFRLDDGENGRRPAAHRPEHRPQSRRAGYPKTNGHAVVREYEEHAAAIQ